MKLRNGAAVTGHITAQDCRYIDYTMNVSSVDNV